MKQNIKLLTNLCCDKLLLFQDDNTLRQSYNQDGFPGEKLEYIDIPTKYFIDENIELIPKPENDIDSSISIFTALKDLDRVQANDRRLWVSLTHNIFFKYAKERWVKNEGYSDSSILERFHFEGSGLRARMRNSISRLWWAARITYDEKKSDPFELTRLLWEKQDLIQNIVERSYGTYDNVVKGFLEVYKTNKHLNKNELRSLYTGLNAIGGVKILSILNKDEVSNEIKRIASYSDIKLNYT